MALVETRSVTTTQKHTVKDSSNYAAVLCKGKYKMILEHVQRGEGLHYVTAGLFNLHELVLELARMFAPVKLYITTFALKETPARAITLALNEGIITEAHLVLDYLSKTRTPEIITLAKNNFSKVALKPIHAKVTVIETAAGYITITGSQNYTTNPKLETGAVCLDSNVGEFYKQWILKHTENGTH